MLEKIDIQLSADKRDFVAPFRVAQLSCDDLFAAATPYARKKKIQLYVQGYIANDKTIRYSVNQDIAHIRTQLKDNNYAGYLYVDGASGEKKVNDESNQYLCD